MDHVVIIGNGISGVTAARHIRKLSHKRITIISSETDFFFSRTALMYVYMGHMRFKDTQPYEASFWKKNNISLKKAYVKEIDFARKTLSLDTEENYAYDHLILAVGSIPNKFGWKGQDLAGVQGLYHYQDLERLNYATQRGIKRGVIVGGGLIGVELAEMLHSKGIDVSFLVRESSFWSKVLPAQESEMITREIQKNGIDLRLETELKEIIGDNEGYVSKIITTTGEEIACEFVGLTAGVSPNIQFLKNTELATARGILVNHFLECNQEDVYAIGDCAEFEDAIEGRRKIEQVWYTGRMMGEVVAKTICGNRTAYTPGHWFNSAKFFDIEYQTYGQVLANCKEGEADFYWEHKDGNKCVHIVFEKESKKFVGINTFGIRMRHHCFDQWLNEERSVVHVLAHLKDANFDPEFYKKYEREIIDKFNRENGTAIKAKKKNWKRIIHSRLSN